MYLITRALAFSSRSPWGEVLNIVRKSLVQRGVVKLDVRHGLFSTTYRHVEIGDLSQAEKQVTELQKTLEKIQAQGEFYQQLLSDIEKGLASWEDDAIANANG